MLPEHRVPAHPGRMLAEEFLTPLGVTPAAFARHIGEPPAPIETFVRGERSLEPEWAWLFVAALGTSPELWTGLQHAFDLATRRPERQVERLAGLG